MTIEDTSASTFIVHNIIDNVIMLARDATGMIRMVTKDGSLIKIYAVRVNSEEKSSSVGIFIKMADNAPIMLMCGSKEAMIGRLNALADSLIVAMPNYERRSPAPIAHDLSYQEEEGRDGAPSPVIDEMENRPRGNVDRRRNMPAQPVKKQGFDLRILIQKYGIPKHFKSEKIMVGGAIMAIALLIVAIRVVTPAPGVDQLPSAPVASQASPVPASSVPSRLPPVAAYSNAADVAGAAIPHSGPFHTPIIPSPAMIANRPPPGIPGGGTLKNPQEFKLFGLKD